MCGHLYLLQSHLPVMIILIVYLLALFSFVPFKSTQQWSEKPKPSSNHWSKPQMVHRRKKTEKEKTQRKKKKCRKNLSHGIHRSIHTVVWYININDLTSIVRPDFSWKIREQTTCYLNLSINSFRKQIKKKKKQWAQNNRNNLYGVNHSNERTELKFTCS